MNFEAFLPSDLTQALNRELEIMKEAASSGTMDVSKLFTAIDCNTL